MTEPGFQPTTRTLEATERADYLDTQTLGGGKGYFHTGNAPTHATDGSAKGQSPETPLVAASSGASPAAQAQTHSQQTSAAGSVTTTAAVITPEDDGLDALTNQKLAKLAKERGVALPKRANKAQLISALRG